MELDAAFLKGEGIVLGSIEILNLLRQRGVKSHNVYPLRPP